MSTGTAAKKAAGENERRGQRMKRAREKNGGKTEKMRKEADRQTDSVM